MDLKLRNPERMKTWSNWRRNSSLKRRRQAHGKIPHKIREPCQGGLHRKWRRPEAGGGSGNFLRDPRGRCGGSSQASRSLSISAYTPVPVSHLPVWGGGRVSWSSGNGNTESRRPVTKEPYSVAHLFLSLTRWKHASPFSEAARAGAADGLAQGFSVAKMSSQAGKNQTVQEYRLEENKLTEFTSEETGNKKKLQGSILRIETIQKTIPSGVQNQADEITLQNILHFLHPSPIRLPKTTILLFLRGSTSYHIRFDSETHSITYYRWTSYYRWTFPHSIFSLWHPDLWQWTWNLLSAWMGRKAKAIAGITHLTWWFGFPPEILHSPL